MRLTLHWLLRRVRVDVPGLERGVPPTGWNLLVAPERVARHAWRHGAEGGRGPELALLLLLAPVCWYLYVARALRVRGKADAVQSAGLVARRAGALPDGHADFGRAWRRARAGRAT